MDAGSGFVGNARAARTWDDFFYFGSRGFIFTNILYFYVLEKYVCVCMC